MPNGMSLNNSAKTWAVLCYVNLELSRFTLDTGDDEATGKGMHGVLNI